MRIRVASMCLALALGACGGDDDDDDVQPDDGGPDDGGFDDREIIVGFADNVVIPTYQLLNERSDALDQAAIALDEDTSDENLDDARTAWIALREPWEQSEGFLFGPVSAQGWDPAMDSWPLNKDDLDEVLASDEVLDQELIRNLPESQKGFHTVEYLLWGQEGEKVALDFTDRELEYLLALTEELTLITSDLASSWTEGVGGDAAYREVFTTAGEQGNTTYPSLSSAAQEILNGMSGICDEVAAGKIEGPYAERDPNLVESQYSFNSLYDFQDNIRSVLNAYTGDFPAGGTEGPGLDEWVAERDPALDERFKAEIQTAIDALGEIPAPFRDAITDPANDDLIEAAQQAISTVQATIDGDLSDLILEQ
jgi:putative iron-regulated protein